MSVYEVFCRGRDARAEPIPLDMVPSLPFIRLHQLARYVGSDTPLERKALLKNEKYRSEHRVSYEPVKRALGEALRLGWDEDELFSITTKYWFAHDLVGAQAIRRRELCVRALVEACLMLEALNERLARLGADPLVVARRWAPRSLAGVNVFDSPSLLLRREQAGREEIGLVSFQVASAHAHSQESAELAAVLVRELAERSRGAEVVVSSALCVVVDIPSGLIVDAARGHLRRLKQAEAACLEIASRWTSV